MKSLTFKILQSISLCILMTLAGSAAATDITDYTGIQKLVTTDEDRSTPEITFLSREVSKSLDITPIPTSEPVPLIVGTYWSCHINEHNFEICRIKIVVCNDDQTSCVDVNAKPDDSPEITFFRKGQSSLPKITPVPSSDPVPLMVGTYWNCHINEHDFEICRLKIVVCEDDGSFCTSIN